MKPRGPFWIVVLAFAAGSVALVTGHLMTHGETTSSHMLQSLMHSRAGSWLAQAWLDRTAPPPAQGVHQAGIGDPRIDMTLPAASGGRTALSHWDGQRVLLNFWAPWCAPCRREWPTLNAFQRQHAGQGIQIVGIAVDRPQDVRAWLRRHVPAYPILMDDPDTHRAASSYGNTRALLPFSVLISNDGRVLRRQYGALSAAQLETWLRP